MSAKAPALADFRRIVVKVGSSLLVDAGAGRLEGGVARRRSPPTSRGCTRTSATSSWCRPARSRSAARCSSCRRARSSSRTARPPPRSARSRSPAPGPRCWAGTASPRARCWSRSTTPRSGGAISTRARPSPSCWSGARVPVINENDTVATTEIRYGDNDRLAARVATMASADLLVLLSDVDGLYDAPPHLNAKRQAHSAGAAHHRRDRGDGGRRRVRSCRAAACAPRSRPARSPPPPACHMVIASGHVDHPLHGDRGRRPRHLVPRRRQSGDLAQEMDRRLARAQGHAHHRRRRCRGAAPRQEPAAGRRHSRRWQLRPRRRGGDPRSGRRRDRPRPRRL